MNNQECDAKAILNASEDDHWWERMVKAMYVTDIENDSVYERAETILATG